MEQACLILEKISSFYAQEDSFLDFIRTTAGPADKKVRFLTNPKTYKIDPYDGQYWKSNGL